MFMLNIKYKVKKRQGKKETIVYREIYDLEHWEPCITKEEKTYNYTIQFRINRIFTVINCYRKTVMPIINCKNN